MGRIIPSPKRLCLFKTASLGHRRASAHSKNATATSSQPPRHCKANWKGTSNCSPTASLGRARPNVALEAGHNALSALLVSGAAVVDLGVGGDFKRGGEDGWWKGAAFVKEEGGLI